MIAGKIVYNQFALLHLILEVKYSDDTSPLPS